MIGEDLQRDVLQQIPLPEHISYARVWKSAMQLMGRVRVVSAGQKGLESGQLRNAGQLAAHHAQPVHYVATVSAQQQNALHRVEAAHSSTPEDVEKLHSPHRMYICVLRIHKICTCNSTLTFHCTLYMYMYIVYAKIPLRYYR